MKNKKIAIREFKKEYLSWSESTQRKNSFIIAKQAFKKFESYLERSGEDVKKMNIGNIQSRHIDKFLADTKKSGLKATSVNAYFRHLKAAFMKAKTWNYLDINPFLGIRQLRIERRQPAFIPKNEIRTFIKSVRDFHKRMIISGYISTGRRRGELLSLAWKDIDFSTRQYNIVSPKAHMTLKFPINDEFLDVLNQLKDREKSKGYDRIFWKWKTPNTVTTFVKKELILGGYGLLRLHDLRHTFAAASLMSGVDIFALQKLLGHSDIKTTMIYSHLTDDHLSEMCNKLEY